MKTAKSRRGLWDIQFTLIFCMFTQSFYSLKPRFCKGYIFYNLQYLSSNQASWRNGSASDSSIYHWSFLKVRRSNRLEVTYLVQFFLAIEQSKPFFCTSMRVLQIRYAAPRFGYSVVVRGCSTLSRESGPLF